MFVHFLISRMFEFIIKHLEYAFNNGKIRSTITVFRHRTKKENDFRIWNSQFLTYAGYEVDSCTIIGDRKNVEFTKVTLILNLRSINSLNILLNKLRFV